VQKHRHCLLLCDSSLPHLIPASKRGLEAPTSYELMQHAVPMRKARRHGCKHTQSSRCRLPGLKGPCTADVLIIYCETCHRGCRKNQMYFCKQMLKCCRLLPLAGHTCRGRWWDARARASCWVRSAAPITRLSMSPWQRDQAHRASARVCNECWPVEAPPEIWGTGKAAVTSRLIHGFLVKIPGREKRQRVRSPTETR
jgi:hypothetical protein